MQDSDPDNQDVIVPLLVGSEKVVSSDVQRRTIILLTVIPYITLCMALFGVTLFSQIAQERLTLAASIALAPLGALTGGIIAYYFKSS